MKKNSMADELADSMEKNLNGEANKSESIKENINLAVDSLHSAADIFESAGYVQASEYITRVLQKFAENYNSNDGDNNVY